MVQPRPVSRRDGLQELVGTRDCEGYRYLGGDGPAHPAIEARRTLDYDCRCGWRTSSLEPL